MQPFRCLTQPLYAAIFAGAAALSLAAPAANASVVYSNLASPLNVPDNLAGIYLNVVTGVYGNNIGSGTGVSGYDIDVYNNGTGLTFKGAASPSGILATGAPGTGAVATALTAGQLISSAGQYNEFQTQGDPFQRTGQEYVGFRFLNESTNAIDYGWLLLQTTNGNSAHDGFPASILSYAYENTGTSILAGQSTSAVNGVPEPATLAMCLPFVGALAFRARKRRPAKSATA